MRKKPARKHRKPAAKKRAANPTKKRAHARKRASKRGKNPVHRTKKQVRRSVVQYSVHARKSNPAKRRRGRKATGFTRAVKRAKKVQGRKRNPASRPHARKGARKGYGRRRSNPASGGTKMTGWSVTDTIIVGVSVVGGMFLANVLDRFVATRHGASTVNTGAFHDAQAATLISAPPDAMRMGAQAGLSILSVVGAYYLSKKGYKKTAEIAVGVGIGAGAHLATQLINDKLLPATMKSDMTATSAGKNLASRLYPDLQEAGLTKMAEDAKTLRANATAGLPRAAAPRAFQGAPRVAAPPAPPPARPAPSTVGCGVDMVTAAQMRAMAQKIEALQAQLASGASNSQAAPPAAAVAADQNVIQFNKRASMYAVSHA